MLRPATVTGDDIVLGGQVFTLTVSVVNADSGVMQPGGASLIMLPDSEAYWPLVGPGNVPLTDADVSNLLALAGGAPQTIVWDPTNEVFVWTPPQVLIRFSSTGPQANLRFPGDDAAWLDTPQAVTFAWDPILPGPATGTLVQVVGAAIASGTGYQVTFNGAMPTSADLNSWVANGTMLTAVLDSATLEWHIT